MSAVAKREYVNDWRFQDGYFVHRYSILTTDRVVYAVFETRNGHHSTMTGPNGESLGTVMSRPLPADVDAIPVRVNGEWNQARIDACDANRDAKAELCYGLIDKAYPGHRGQRNGHGDVEGLLLSRAERASVAESELSRLKVQFRDLEVEKTCLQARLDSMRAGAQHLATSLARVVNGEKDASAPE